MKISDTPSFLKKTVFYQHLPFYGKNRKPPPLSLPFLKILKNSLNGGGSYVLEKKSSGKFDFLRFYLKKNKILSKSVKDKFSNNP